MLIANLVYQKLLIKEGTSLLSKTLNNNDSKSSFLKISYNLLLRLRKMII